MVCNIAAGTQTQIQGILNLGLVPPLIDVVKNGEFKAQKEAAWALTNLTSGGSLDQIGFLANAGGIQALCSLLTCRDSKVIFAFLLDLHRVLGK